MKKIRQQKIVCVCVCVNKFKFQVRCENVIKFNELQFSPCPAKVGSEWRVVEAPVHEVVLA